MKFFAAIAAAFSLSTVAGMSANGEALKLRKVREWDLLKKQGLMPRQVSSVMNQAASCTDGSVDIGGEAFPCEEIDFEGFLALADATFTNGGQTSAGSDIWGWLSPEGKEITLWCVDNGIWFVDTTDPADMQQLGYMPSARPQAAWCDVKVYQDVAYVVKDGSAASIGVGIEVFDLTRLVGLSADKSRSFEPDFIYGEHERSHNLAVDTESGFLYSVGTNTCLGGLHVVDLSNPLEPEFSTCISSDGYTHDVQCVVYDGPDVVFSGHQICFAFNEDTLTIWDVTDKSAPNQLARMGYENSMYTHQGWLTADMRRVIMNDELDEANDVVDHTTTYFVNVETLTDPFIESVFVHPEVSIDHNLYVWGAIHAKGWGGNPAMSTPPSDRYAYLSNYIAGIKVLDLSDTSNIVEVGKFDVAPDIEGNVFEGTWSNYMHPSGVLAVSSIDRGLFTLRPRMVFDDNLPPTPFSPVPAPTPAPPTPSPTTPPPIPEEWICPESWYGGADIYCDCECGAPDIMCELDPDAPVYGCPNDTDLCIEGVCFDANATFAPSSSPTAGVTSSPTSFPTDLVTESPTTGTVTASPTPNPVATNPPVDSPSGGDGGIFGDELVFILLGVAVVLLVVVLAMLVYVLTSKKKVVATEQTEMRAYNLAYDGK